MKRIVENFRDFITGSEIHQNPGAWDYYGTNPKKKKAKSRRPRRNRQSGPVNKNLSGEN